MQYLDLLEELLSQNEFELLMEEGKDPRLVYLMNDAVESFLVFEKGVVTGEYDPDFRGELDVTLFELEKDPQEENMTYHLAVAQGENVVSLFFEKISLQVFCYNYGRIAHFWVERYENLRQIEYRLAILRDKIFYLGEEYANEEEKMLYHLETFPPLNYTCYPAVSAKYLVTREGAWNPTEKGIEVMKKLCVEAGDLSMKLLVNLYQKIPAKIMAKMIAYLLSTPRHSALTDLIDDKIEQASSLYPDRKFEEPFESNYRSLLDKANDLAAEENSKTDRKRVRVLAEEPFTTARDSVAFHVYYMEIENIGFKRRIRIKTLS